MDASCRSAISRTSAMPKAPMVPLSLLDQQASLSQQQPQLQQPHPHPHPHLHLRPRPRPRPKQQQRQHLARLQARASDSLSECVQVVSSHLSEASVWGAAASKGCCLAQLAAGHSLEDSLAAQGSCQEHQGAGTDAFNMGLAVIGTLPAGNVSSTLDNCRQRGVTSTSRRLSTTVEVATGVVAPSRLPCLTDSRQCAPKERSCVTSHHHLAGNL